MVPVVISTCTVMFFSVCAFAQTEPPQFMTVDGRLYDAANSSQPLLDASVHLRIQVLNPAKTCILYEEEQTVSTLSSSGYFNLRVGSPTSGADSLKRTSYDSANSMMAVFQNQNTAITGQTSSAIGCSYTPSPGESRYFRFIVTPSTTGVTSTLSPDMTIDSVPQSLVAESLQGLSTDDFIQVSANVTQAKAESLFGASYATLTGLLAGSSSLYLQSTTNGTVIPSRPTDPASPVPGQIWYDSATDELKYWDGTVAQVVGGTASDPTKLPLAGGTMVGAINMGSNDITSTGHITQSAQRTLRFGGYTGGQEATLIATPLTVGQEGTTWYNTTTDKLMYWDGTASQELLTATSANSLVPHCNPDESLEMSVGPTYVWSCVATTDSTKLALTGGSLTGAVVMTAQNQVRFADAAGGEYAAVRAPTTVGTNYVLTLPDTAGSAGQVLQTDGTGVLSWMSPAAAPVSSVFGRTGAVVATAGDYTAAQVTNTAAGTIAATDVQGAINELDTEKVPTTRTLTTAANSGLSGGGDLSANRTFVVDITGTTAETVVAGADEILIYDVSASALRKMTRTNFVLSETEVDAMVANNGYLTAEADTLATVTARGAATAVNITMNTQAQVRYADAAGGEYAAIQAPATIGANYVLTLPDDDGNSGQYLQTDGSGNLSWVTPAGVGETNTASNVTGSTGVGLFKQKSTFDLQFKSLLPGSNKLTISGGASDVTLDVDDTKLNLGNIPNTATGNIVATDAQSAINELDTEKVAKSGDTMTGRLVMGPKGLAAGDGGSVAFTELAAGGTNVAVIRSPDALAADYSLTLPTSAGSSGQILSTDGTGILSWISSPLPSADTLDFTEFKDSMTLDASTDMAVTGTNVLSITNSGTGNSFVVNDQAGDTSPFVIDASGNVGIGTTNPAEVLHVSGGDARIQGVNSSGTSGSLSLVNTAPAASGVGSSLGFIGQGSAYIGSITGAWEGATNTMGSLRFVTNNSGALQEQMRISSTGLVGIGTTNPGTILDAAGAFTSRPYGTATGETGQLIMRELAAGGTETATIRAPDAITTSYALTLPTSAGSSGQVLQTDGSGVLSWVSSIAPAADSLDFTHFADNMTLDASTDIAATGTNVFSITNTGTGNSFVVNDQAADTTSFIIDASGKVGIGTASPRAALDVVNDIALGSATNTPDIKFDNLKALVGGDWIGSLTFSESSVGSMRIVSRKSDGLQFRLNGVADTDIKVSFKESGNVGIGTITPGTLLDVAGAITSRPYGTATGETGQLIMRELAANGTNTVTIRSPDANAADYVLTLPADDGTSGQVLSTDGSGVLSWVSSIAPAADSLDFTHFSDTMTLDANTDIAATGTNVLSITNSGTGNSFVVNDQAADTTPFVVDASGNVGIGTTVVIGTLNTSSTTGSVLTMSRNDTVATNGQSVGKIQFWNNDSNLSTQNIYANIEVTTAQIITTDAAAGNMVFRTTDTTVAGSPVERLRITSNGNIGIGGATPTPFDVASNRTVLINANNNYASELILGANGAASSANSSISFTQDGNRTAYIMSKRTSTSTLDSNLVFANSDGTTLSEKMRIDIAGNVGIGTTVPGTLLDVTGAMTSRPYGTGTGQTGQLIMRELAAGGTETAMIRAPDAITTSYALTLPTTAGGSGQLLSTDGTGILSWISSPLPSANTLDFTELKDSMTLDASTDIAATGTNVLSITNSGTGNSFLVNDQTADTSPFVIDASGKVGVGTTTPSKVFEVWGTSTSNIAEFINDRSGNSIYPAVSFSRMFTGVTQPQAGFGTGIELSLEGTSDGSLNPTAAIYTAWEVNPTSGANRDAYLSFSTQLDGAAPAERMRIDSAGKVGIGTTVPGTILDAVGAITSRPYGTATGETGQLIMRELAAGGTETAMIRAPDAITTSYALTLPTTAGGSGQLLSTDGTGILSWISSPLPSADTLDFTELKDSMTLDASTDISATGTNVLSITNSGTGNSFLVNDAASDTTPFVIDAGGNVGVGVSAPSATLHAVSTTEQLRLAYDASNYMSLTVGSGGTVTLDSVTSGSPKFAFSDAINVSAFNSAFTSSLSGNGEYYGVQSSLTNTNGGTAAEAVGLKGIAVRSHSTPDPTLTFQAKGVYGIGKYSNTGTLNSAAGVYGWVENTSSGTITDAYSIYGATPTATAGAITRAWAGGFNGNVWVGGSVGIGTTVPGTLLDVAGAITSRPYGTATGETGQLIMRELAAGGTETATIRAPDAITTSYALTLPTTAGSSGQVLRTDGSGVLSWINSDASITADILDFAQLADNMTLDASTDIAATGTNVLSITNSGTGNSFVVNDQAADTSPFVIDATGNVGIGTTTLSANTKLDVNGQIRTSVSSIATRDVDFAGGNTVTSSYNCGSPVTLANIRQGGSYTVVMTDTGTTTCSFDTAVTGDDAATVTYRFQPANGLRTASSHTVYSMLRVGNVIYVSWITGFQ